MREDRVWRMDAHVQQGDEVARLYGRKNLTVGNAVAQRRAAAHDVVHPQLPHVFHASADEQQRLPRDAARPETHGAGKIQND